MSRLRPASDSQASGTLHQSRCHAHSGTGHGGWVDSAARGCLVVANYFLGVGINLVEAARRWQRDDAGLLAACVAYYATVSLFPLMMVLIAGLGLFLRFTNLGQDAEEYVLTAIAQTTSFDVAMQVASAFNQVQQQALLSGPLGIMGLVLAALAVFSQFDQALDRIWSIPTPPFEGYVSTLWRLVSHRIKAFVVLLSMGLIVVLIFFAGMGLAAVRQLSTERFPIADQAWRMAEILLSVFLNTLVFTAIYRWLSKVPVGWLHAARGGLLAAVTWELGRLVLAAFLIGTHYSAYGVVGSLLAAMLWAYYASSVLFLGAEYVQVIRERGLASAGKEAADALLAETVPLNRSACHELAFNEWAVRSCRRRAA